MDPVDPAFIYRRRSYITQNRNIAGFTVPQGTYTYIILAELNGKWAPFWAYKVLTTDYDSEFISLLTKEMTNVEHLLTNSSPTDDSVATDPDVVELAARL